jgi:hypothetical protein
MNFNLRKETKSDRKGLKHIKYINKVQRNTDFHHLLIECLTHIYTKLRV